MAALRDPKRRAREATLARLLGVTIERPAEDGPDAPLRDAFALAGYRGL
jgi:hypothetical protein